MHPNFEQLAEQYRVDVVSCDKRLKILSSLRLIVFVGSLVIVLTLANARLATLMATALVAGATTFGLILNRYNLLLHDRNRLNSLKQINEQEMLIRQRKLRNINTGEELMHPEHAYAMDLDVLGQHSLFQILNRTTTEAGRIELTDWLMQPTEPDLILERQKAAKELAPKIEWRQEFQAAGMPFINLKSSYTQLSKWIEAPAVLLFQERRHLATAIMLGLACTMAAMAGIRHILQVLSTNKPLSIIYLVPVLFTLVVNRQVLKKMRTRTERVLNDLQYSVPILAASESLIRRIELASFESALLQKWQSVFVAREYSATKEILHLRKILEAFQQRGSLQMLGKNDFYSIFNAIWLLDIYFILCTERWKAKNGHQLKEWSIAVGRFEAINSLAGFSYANPEFVFPGITKKNYHIDFKGIGHPLLKEDQRICNDFELTERGSVVVITGSNMAGKSTFLRTVGCNLILAMMGGPCCALSAQISPMALFTSMRTQDNLEEGISSFYAELKRVEKLLKLMESGQPVLFLLDEMFKGTNSDDRYKGGVSLIRQLSALNAFGIISTHDLQLAKVASQHLPILNYSFNSELKDGMMIFDYKLREGFCVDFNASELMKRSGIHILPDV